jgi:arylsulfatase A-like enzyme
MRITTCFTATILLLLAATLSQAAQPNIVIFLADDQGYGDLSCYGHPTLKTTGIDRLAAEGMRFEKAFLTISSCSPTRCSLLTGRYPHNTGAEDLHEPLPAEQVSLAQLLKAKGYHNMAVGKWHLGEAEREHWHAIEECGGAELGSTALKLLAERPKDKPFFFWVASKDPHRPYGERTTFGQYSPDQAIVPPYLPDHPLIREDMADYYEEIVRFSGQVNHIVSLLEEQGVLDETFIAYLSDNGMPFPRAKTTLYDSGIRTPLIVRYPPLVKPGTLQRNLVSTIDLTATVAEIAELDQSTMQGESLVPMLRDFQAPGREAIYAEANWHDFEKFTRAVRTDRYLLIRNYYWEEPLWNSVDSLNSKTWVGMLQMHRQGKLTTAQKFLFQEPRPYEEFYDLQVDPQSLENVIDAAQHTAAVNRLRTLLDNWRVATQDHMPEQRRRDGWTRDGRPLPHNQPWYDKFIEAGGKSDFENF